MINMSFLKKIAEIARKQNDEMSIGGPGGNDGATDPRNRLRPPDNRVMADQGIGGYLNPNQLEMFTNPPSPDNSAGQKNMADLLQQQADTFGGMLTYAPPPKTCLLYTSPSPRDRTRSRMPSSA